ncbi:RidA family protein [Catalinimonas niigatensis]|uniref:RidA family protein n=1 Tax=Catalinimonas niigatensis TaxID=1397264 RepID=UPI002665B594|nr:RidA family protein [Catalinimonas niigatensis]WPP48866.1 RidA family protein [Catalinimonas niigatensis]
MNEKPNHFMSKLKELEITLYPPPLPGGTYDSVNIRNHVAFVAIQFPIRADQYLYVGRLGNKLSSKEGYQAAQLAAKNILSQIHQYVGFEKVAGLNHLDIYYQAHEDWDEGPFVADGASELFLKVLEEKGRHTRSIFGVHKLPRNFCVGITASFSLIS